MTQIMSRLRVWGAPAIWGLSSDRLHTPPWHLCLLFAAGFSVLVCYPAWPGLMSFDSLFAYKESITGIETQIWPPMHAYLLFVSRTLTGGPGGLFVLQTFLLALGGAGIIGTLTGSRPAVALGLVFFGAAFWGFPTLLGTTIAFWKDVPVVSFALMAMFCWLTALRRGSVWIYAGALFFIFLATATRWNAVTLYGPWLGLVILFPWNLTPRLGQRGISLVCILATLGLATATGAWRLPDFKKLPPIANAMAPNQRWDMIGTSLCAGKVLIPAQVIDGPLPTLGQLRTIYSPKHLNETLLDERGPVWLQSTLMTDKMTQDAWLDLMRNHTGCFLSHRLFVEQEQYGLVKGHVFYAAHGGIDANPYGLKNARPGLALKLTAWINRASDQGLRRAWVLSLAGLMAGLWLLAKGPHRGLVLALVLGEIASALALALLAPAADARYAFPTNVISALFLALALAQVLDSHLRRRQAPV